MTTVRRCAAALAATAVLCVATAPAAVAGGDVPAAPGSPASPGSPVSPGSPASPDPDGGSASGSPSNSPSNSPSGASPGASPSTDPSPAAPVPSPAPVTLPPGLYGEKDPTYDGVWRQSLAMLGQFAAGVRPADQAVTWLKGQQCADGAFPAYRPDPAAPCDAKTAVDSNSTAAAMQALATLGGQRPAIQKSMEWLRSVQNKDGGWGYLPGTPTDANSTSLVIGALTTFGVRPSSMRSSEGRNAYDALVALAIPCDAGSGADAGAFAYQPDKAGKLTANDDATAAAVLGGLGKRMMAWPVEAGPAPSCVPAKDPGPERAARNGAAYLASALAATGHLDQPPLPGADDTDPLPDTGNTADAVVALTAAGYGDQASGALEWLKRNAAAWARENGPAAYAQLIFAAHATGTDPRDFGGIDLVGQLNATGPTPKPMPSTTAPAAATVSSGNSGRDQGLLWILGAGAIACAGMGFLLNGRRKTRQP
ncbi:prenyltransferase/squalene oxidase repeat-containing protein [Streptomyces sp. NPDC002018]|uniref:prenyltransferase/squalene oxidase repeat-containing protein n=1 Tax=Streptomyces sp. NPDC002018 TaxID=3364629 RepID=UPI00367E4B9F